MRGRLAVTGIVAALVMAAAADRAARAQPAAAVAIDPDDIGGTVSSADGPEAGVWVIAETESLPTLYRKIVVTDDQGRYLLPDLPLATYASGCAAMDSSIPRRSVRNRGKSSISVRPWLPTPDPPPRSIPRTTGTR
jgi:hypothetical protein